MLDRDDGAGGMAGRGDADRTGYPGGKGQSGLIQWILGMLPGHVYYCEPFAGHAGVFRAKGAALRSWLIDRDEDVSMWLRGAVGAAAMVECGDGVRWMELAAEWGWGPGEGLVYVDPPYLMSTRSGRRRYAWELTAWEHRRILSAAVAMAAAVVISGYESRLYMEMLEGWRCERRRVRTRWGGWRTECVWLNGACAAMPPGAGGEYARWGGTFRERGRVSKRVDRWGRRFSAMAAAERRAVLGRLLAIEAGQAMG